MNFDDPKFKESVRHAINLDKANPESLTISQECIQESMRAAQDMANKAGFDISDPQEVTFVLALMTSGLPTKLERFVLTVFGVGLLHNEKNQYQPGSENDLH
jgi:hypothetical protein